MLDYPLLISTYFCTSITPFDHYYISEPLLIFTISNVESAVAGLHFEI